MILNLEPAPGARVVADHFPGTGTPTVFLHGLSSVRAGEKSEALARHVSARGRPFWRFDFRGHGESSGVPGQVTLTELMEDARCVLERSGPAVLFGSSLGGLIASWTAAQHPELVRGLCLLAPAIGFVPRMAAHPREQDMILVASSGQEIRLSTKVLDDARRYDEDQLPTRLRCPVLVIHGAKDDTVPLQYSERFFDRLQSEDRDLWVLPDGDHRLNEPIREILTRYEEFFRWY